MEAFVVAETHWDREWYRTFQQFRFRLVKLVDSLIDLLQKDPRFQCFTLDGQTIVVEDYLEARPEKEEELRRLVQAGRLHIGPWYVLADEFLVSGEALIRNLLRGRRMAERFGRVMMVGYTPDPFGHISQLPTILRGFGIDSVIFTRGMGQEGGKLPSEFIWQSAGPGIGPDVGPGAGSSAGQGADVDAAAAGGGRAPSSVLAHHQVAGYGNFAGVGYENWEAAPGTEGSAVDFRAALRRTLELLRKIGPLSPAGVLLFNNGSDHLFAQPELPDIIEFINKEQDLVHLVQGSYEEYVARLKERYAGPGVVAGSAGGNLPVYRGEMRGGRFHNLLPGVLSTRMYLKQANERTQTVLERYAEPWAALAWAAGLLPYYPGEFIGLAWKYCLQNHPHDSICGCSIDQVHREMIPRFDQAGQIAELVARDSMAAIAKEVDTRLHGGHRERGRHPPAPGLEREYASEYLAKAVVVFNSLNWQREGRVELEFEESAAEAAIPGRWSVVGTDGREVPAQSAVRRELVPAPGNPVKTVVSVRFIAPDVPAMGYRTFWLVKAAGSGETDPPLWVATAGDGAQLAENRFLRVAVAGDGSFSVTDKRSGATFSDLGFFEDSADAGDEYDFSPPAEPGIETTEARPCVVRLVDSGPVEAAWEVEREWFLPARLNEARSGRSPEVAPVRMRSTIRLSGGSPYLEVITVVDNQVEDHRLRVVFPTGLHSGSVNVESTFDVVTRKLGTDGVVMARESEWVQPLAPANAQKSFVSVSDGTNGLTVLNRGLPEYEAGDGTFDRCHAGVSVAVTLLRCVGWLSRGDLGTRRDNAGPALPTPEAQCRGTHTFEYAVYPHGGNWKAASAARIAREYATPLQVQVEPLHAGRFPAGLSLVECSAGEKSQLLLSALKKAEKDERLILRWFNPGEEDEKIGIKFPFPLSRASLVNLAEEEVEEVPVNELSLSIPPKGLISLAVTVAGER